MTDLVELTGRVLPARPLCRAVRIADTKPGSRPQSSCGRPATIPVEYGCVHEHIGSIDVCDRHAKEIASQVTWCSACWNSADPHRCLLIGRVVAP